MGKKSKNRDRNFYSTDPDFSGFDFFEKEETDTPASGDQQLKVFIEKKGRRGKAVTIVSGFAGSDADLTTLARTLKTRCGVGGSVKEGEIILQGLLRDKVVKLLTELGYQAR